MAWLATSSARTSISSLDVITRPLFFTFWQATLSTILTIIVGFPAAFIFAKYKFWGKSVFRLLTTLPFIMPTIVVAAGFNALLGPKGWLNILLQAIFSLEQPPIQIMNTLIAILIAHVFYNSTVFIRVVGGAWSQLDPKFEFAARTLGASNRNVWRYITIPLLKPAIFSAILLVFLFNFTSFAVILLLGGPSYATMEVEIYIQAMHLLNLPVAGILSAIQLACTLVFTIIYSRLINNKNVSLIFRVVIKYITPTFLVVLLVTWTYQQAIPVLRMEDVPSENFRWVLGTRIILVTIIISVIMLVYWAWRGRPLPDIDDDQVVKEEDMP